jgi:long-chain acyl-CoA synthetase
MNLQTLNDVFFAVIEHGATQVMLHREADRWVSISSQELRRRVVALARSLHSLGFLRGDRIAILSENRPEWAVVDFACLLLGAVVVPIYTTLTAEQTAYILRDSEAKAIFVSNEKQMQKILAIQKQTAVHRIVVMDSTEVGRAISLSSLTRDDDTQDRDPQFEAAARTVTPDDLATIIYTSGTTGTPKGAMLTHGNMASNISCSLAGFDMHPGQTSISFLPLSHVTARHVDFAMLYHGITLAYIPFVDQLSRALMEVRPTIFVAVPRVYEKIYTQVDQKTKGFPKRNIYRWALSVGETHKPEILAGKTPHSAAWKLANRLIYSRVRAGMGGRVELFISGGAPLGRELADWYATIGIRIHEGYGLTETSPVIAVNNLNAHKMGTVGKPLSNVEVRIAEDGEVLVRGPSVFKGYWNKADETREAFVDGWFKTGDIGNLDAEGFLSITDRKKDLIKTSGGKFIAPQPIENALKHHALIAEAVVLGDKHKFPAVLIAPAFTMLEDWARDNQVSCSSRSELIASPEVLALYEGIVEEYNQKLARFEKLKKIILVADEFSTENGTLTASMKLRRRVVVDRYRREIEEMYAKAEAAGPVEPAQ